MTTTTMTPKDVLIAAKALIDTPEKWCQMEPEWDGKRCALRALDDADGGSAGTETLNYVHSAIPHQFVVRARNCGHFSSRDRITEYNDCRTHRGVMRWFDRAIALAAES